MSLFHSLTYVQQPGGEVKGRGRSDVAAKGARENVSQDKDTRFVSNTCIKTSFCCVTHVTDFPSLKMVI